MPPQIWKSNSYGTIPHGEKLDDFSPFQYIMTTTAAVIATVEIVRGTISAAMDMDSTASYSGLYTSGVIVGALVASCAVHRISVKSTLLGLYMTLICSFILFLSIKNTLLLKFSSFGAGFGSVRY